MGRTLNRGREEGLSIDCDSNWSLPAPAMTPPALPGSLAQSLIVETNRAHQHHNATLPLALFSSGAGAGVFSDAKSTKF